MRPNLRNSIPISRCSVGVRSLCPVLQCSTRNPPPLQTTQSCTYLEKIPTTQLSGCCSNFRAFSNRIRKYAVVSGVRKNSRAPENPGTSVFSYLQYRVRFRAFFSLNDTRLIRASPDASVSSSKHTQTATKLQYSTLGLIGPPRPNLYSDTTLICHASRPIYLISSGTRTPAELTKFLQSAQGATTNTIQNICIWNRIHTRIAKEKYRKYKLAITRIRPKHTYSTFFFSLFLLQSKYYYNCILFTFYSYLQADEGTLSRSQNGRALSTELRPYRTPLCYSR